MRSYPRSLTKAGGKRIRVNNPTEEYEAGLEGYESHRNPKINEKQKGTDKEVLRERPIIELSAAEKLAQRNAVESAKKELRAEAVKLAQVEIDKEEVIPEPAKKVQNRPAKRN